MYSSRRNHSHYNSESWKRQSRATRERDGWTCQKCGWTAYGRDRYYLHAHHRRPYGLGGGDDSSNLTSLCLKCHADQPGHAGLKNSTDYKHFLAARGEERRSALVSQHSNWTSTPAPARSVSRSAPSPRPSSNTSVSPHTPVPPRDNPKVSTLGDWTASQRTSSRERTTPLQDNPDVSRLDDPWGQEAPATPQGAGISWRLWGICTALILAGVLALSLLNAMAIVVSLGIAGFLLGAVFLWTKF